MIQQGVQKRYRGTDDDGVAMVMVLGIVLIGAIILTTLAFVTMYNTTRTFENRAEMRALASADSGVDMILSQLHNRAYADLGSVCSDTFTINNDQVAVTTQYTVKRGGAETVVECPLPTDITSQLRVTSTATTPVSALTDAPVSRTVSAIIVPTPPEMLLDKAIFSEGTVFLTNESKLISSGLDGDGNPLDDAHVYSNGSITCETNEVIEGRVIAAHGDVQLTNTCKIHSAVWASGTVRIPASGPFIDGNVFAASDNAESFMIAGNARVSGVVLTNGGVTVKNSAVVGKSVVARTGGITFENTPSVGGSVYAQGPINLAQGSVGADATSMSSSINGAAGSSISGHALAGTTISGPPHPSASSRTAGTPTVFPPSLNPGVVLEAGVGYSGGAYNAWQVNPPKREQMPQLYMGADELSKWEAQGYSVLAVPDKCTGDDPRNVINSLNWSVPRVLIFTGCTGPVEFNNAEITLGNSLALVSDTGFKMENQTWFRSSETSGDPRTLHVIVPAGATDVDWVPEPGGSGQMTPACQDSRHYNPWYYDGSGPVDLWIDSMGVRNVETMFYTPCGFQMQNGLLGGSDPIKGQVYGGVVKLPVKITLEMGQVPVPSLSTSVPDAASPADMRLRSRFDVAG